MRAGAPDYSLSAAALGVALNNPLAETGGHNLAREFRPEVPIHEIFPWADLAFQAVLAAGVSLMVGGVAADADTLLRNASSKVQAFTWLKDQDQPKLETQKRGLEERIRVLEAFQKSRVLWSGKLHTIAAAAPPTTIITSLNGSGEFEAPTKGNQNKGKLQLVVNFSTPLAEDGAMPGEIDTFLSALRAEATILREFPSIEVSGLRTGSSGFGSGKAAQFSVVCMPRVEPAKGARPR